MLINGIKCYFTLFQYALPMESLTRKLSNSKKSLSEILTQKNLQIDVSKFFK